MTDAELWQACVESGFVASEWWPKWNGFPLDFAPNTLGGTWWYASPSGDVPARATEARARILSALVEWATTDHKWITTLLHGHEKYATQRWFATVEACAKRADGRGETRELALLACYRQWKENA